MMSTILDEETDKISFHRKDEETEDKLSNLKEDEETDKISVSASFHRKDEESSKATKVSKDKDNTTKDNVLEQLENGDITLGSAFSEQSEKMPKKIVGGRKSATSGDLRGKKAMVKKAVSQELYKNL